VPANKARIRLRTIRPFHCRKTVSAFREPRLPAAGRLAYHRSLKPLLIGIAGPSCAGKSELAQRLGALLPATVVSLDRYYRDLSHLSFEERTRWNFDVPDALELDLLASHLKALAAGETVEIPVYDFTQHVRTSRRTQVAAADCVVFEGLFTLYREDIRALLDFRVFVEAPDEVCFARRLERDVRERGRTPESVRQQFESTVRPMAERYILPTRVYADVVLDGTAPREALVESVLHELERRGLWPQRRRAAQ